jgi:hypothetical protein
MSSPAYCQSPLQTDLESIPFFSDKMVAAVEKKTQMELWTEMQQAREACDGDLSYEALEKFYITALASQHIIDASHILEELEALEFMDPSLRGRSQQITMKFIGDLDDQLTPMYMGSPDYDTSDEEEESSEQVEGVEMFEPRWCQVRHITPVLERVSLSSELVNNVPEGNPIRLTGKKKGDRVQIDQPYKGWLSIDSTTLPQMSAADTSLQVPLSPEFSPIAACHLSN